MTRPAPPGPSRARVGVISLGCAKNLVDTEVMLGHLEASGATFVQDPADADVIVVNTCGFIEAAREESIQAILEAAELRSDGRLRRLVVAGCMVQRYPRDLRENLPEVDAWVGLDRLQEIVAAAGIAPAPEPSRGAVPLEGSPATYLYDHATPRRTATPPWTAFVKIAEGCDRPCAFCAIPSIRGAFRSRGRESVLEEAKALVARGAKEINLISQDTSEFGRDRGEPDALVPLLEDLDAIDGLRWIRLLYLHPASVSPRLVNVMARLPRVVEYVDVPLQHAHPAVLRRMRRGGSARSHLDLLARFRAAMPDAAIRSSFIVGFPGETEEEFEALLEFVAEARLQHLGAFEYSHEEGTAAYALGDDVPPEVKEERRGRLMELQQRIVLERNAAAVGRRVEVLMEGAHPDTEHLLSARMRTQAPDVDGRVILNEGFAPAGSIVTAEIVGVAGYDLVGRIPDGI